MLNLRKKKNKLKVLYEDSEVLAIDKPSGLVVNRSKTTKNSTVQDYVTDLIDFSDCDPSSEFVLRSGIVHRLDKDTSGVLLIAKTSKAFSHLQKQFKDRQIKKKYLTLLLGNLKDDLLEVDAPIGRDVKNRFRFAVTARGKKATTRFEKIKDLSGLSLVYVYPKTGRTHQIRVHSAALGHSVVGDPIYCTKKQLDVWRDQYNRLMLHACTIEFTQPLTKEAICVSSPIPREFPM